MGSSPHDQVLEQLRIAQKMLRALEELGRDAGTCNHELVRGYALRALHALQSAEQMLGGNPSPRIQG